MDTHTDTPLAMIRPGFDFGKNNEQISHRSKVDLPRMKEGNRDARQRTLLILDSIGVTVDRLSGDLEVATEASDLKRIARQDKHAIYLCNITLELLRRGYSPREIKKIWVRNLTRVFREVEQAVL